ncbi:hypothetical protein [Niveispirillum fermenti]|uniref:hypothetical protein n=1 Tax=Niveispirillum fermenti TaxID=1233113 RepID=UPI003A837842
MNTPPVLLNDGRDAATAQRRLLGLFLRERRARLDPAAVGIGSLGRRRAPGLRREEVAMLAGISPTWLT